MAQTTSNKPQSWIPLWPPASRRIRIPHILLLAAVSTLLIVAILREQLLSALTAVFGTAPSPALSPTSPTFVHDRPSLEFHSGGFFKIAIFEDLHFGEAQDTLWGPHQDQMSLAVMRTILDKEQPDLVVLNGDLVTGDDTMLANSTDYLDVLVQPMVERNIPWASTYGNHDIAYNLSTGSLLVKETSYPLSLTECHVKRINESGVSNYFLPVWSVNSTTKESTLGMVLWFFDSQGGKAFQTLDETGEQVQLPSVIPPNTAEWFKRQSHYTEYRHGKWTPSLAFVHIPVTAMLDYQQMGIDSHKEPGINDDDPLSPMDQGGDRAFLQALEDVGTLGLFSAHDHGDDWCMPYANMFFCFGRHTGYGGYGHWMRGSRILNINLTQLGERKLETWIRLEDGSVSGHVMLNETFGIDEYPVANNRTTRLPPTDKPMGVGEYETEG